MGCTYLTAFQGRNSGCTTAQIWPVWDKRTIIYTTAKGTDLTRIAYTITLNVPITSNTEIPELIAATTIGKTGRAGIARMIRTATTVAGITPITIKSIVTNNTVRFVLFYTAIQSLTTDTVIALVF